uniref:Protein Star-like n=2 Tax=Hirondellea gigas TaxID=1518452 RepID=A0A2P2IF97_9CRUS
MSLLEELSCSCRRARARHPYVWQRLADKLHKALAFLLLVTTMVFLLGLAAGVVHTGSNIHRLHVGIGRHHSDAHELHLSLGSSEHQQHRLKGPLQYDDEFVLQVIRSKYLVAPSPSDDPYHLESTQKYEDFLSLVSWVFLSSRIKAVLGPKRGGFFVEAGALDGQFLSNTLPLERELGWTGLLVEANSRSYQELQKRNRKAWLSPACLSPSNYPQELILNQLEMKHTRKEDQYPWIARGSSHLQSTAGHDQDVMLTQYHTTYASVQCFPLASMLLALNTSHVDLLSLDVEGSEPAILRSMPWSQFTVSVLLVEHHGEKHGRDMQFHNFLASQGFMMYDHLTDGEGVSDYVFLSNDYWKVNKEKIEKRAVGLPKMKKEAIASAR